MTNDEYFRSAPCGGNAIISLSHVSHMSLNGRDSEARNVLYTKENTGKKLTVSMTHLKAGRKELRILPCAL